MGLVGPYGWLAMESILAWRAVAESAAPSAPLTPRAPGNRDDPSTLSRTRSDASVRESIRLPEQPTTPRASTIQARVRTGISLEDQRNVISRVREFALYG
jgi:hypothetical protein